MAQQSDSVDAGPPGSTKKVVSSIDTVKLVEVSLITKAGGPISAHLATREFEQAFVEAGVSSVRTAHVNEDGVFLLVGEGDALNSLLATGLTLYGTHYGLVRGWAAAQLPKARLIAFCLFGAQLHMLTTPERLAASASLRYGCNIAYLDVIHLRGDPVSTVGIVFEVSTAGATALHGQSWRIAANGAACTVGFIRLDGDLEDAPALVRRARQAALTAPAQPPAAVLSPSRMVPLPPAVGRTGPAYGAGGAWPLGGRRPPLAGTGAGAGAGAVALRRAASGREERPGMIRHMAIFLDAENCQVHPKAGR